MKEKSQRQMCDFLKKNGIDNFIGVPDSTMKYFINQAMKKNSLLISTREEEAIGIAVGMSLAKSNSLVFMQNAGFGNSISTLTSLVQLYKIPILLLIGWRGYLSSDAPEHIKFGKIQPKILKTLGLKSLIVTETNWMKCCKYALSLLKKNIPCALIIRREFDD